MAQLLQQSPVSRREIAIWITVAVLVAGTAGFFLGTLLRSPVATNMDSAQASSPRNSDSDSHPLLSASVDNTPYRRIPVNPAALPSGRHTPGEIGTASAEKMRKLSEARQAELEARFKSEPVNIIWSNTAESALLDAASSGEIAESGITPGDIDIQCRSSSCRVSALFPPGGDADTWTSYYILQFAGTLPRSEIVTMMRPDGTTEVSLYGHR